MDRDVCNSTWISLHETSGATRRRALRARGQASPKILLIEASTPPRPCESEYKSSAGMPLNELKGLGTSGTLSQLSRQASTDDVKARVRRSSMAAERMLVHQKSFALEEEKVKREAGLHDARWSTMFPSLGRQMAKSNSKLALFLISPLSPRLAVWDIVTGIALIFTLISTPYEVGFLPSPKHANEPLFIANRLIDAIFILDMVKEFFLCVPADRVARAEEALAKAVSKSVAENKPTALAKAQKELEDSMMHLQDFETDMGEIAKRCAQTEDAFQNPHMCTSLC